MAVDATGQLAFLKEIEEPAVETVHQVRCVAAEDTEHHATFAEVECACDNVAALRQLGIDDNELVVLA